MRLIDEFRPCLNRFYVGFFFFYLKTVQISDAGARTPPREGEEANLSELFMCVRAKRCVIGFVSCGLSDLRWGWAGRWTRPERTARPTDCEIRNALTAALASAILAFLSRVLAASKSRRLTCSSFRSFYAQKTRHCAKEQKIWIKMKQTDQSL